MNSSQQFWSTYFRHSLGVEWRLGPEKINSIEESSESKIEPLSTGKTQEPEPKTGLIPVIAQPFVFVSEPLQPGGPLDIMIKKMAVALKLDGAQLYVLGSDGRPAIKKALSELKPTQKILFFGASKVLPKIAKSKSVNYGAWSSSANCPFMVTHELVDLQANPKLKKQTWAHLQKFVGLKP